MNETGDSTRPLTLVVPQEHGGSRLDHYLAEVLPDRTRSALRRWILDGRVRIDRQEAQKPGQGLVPGMRIDVLPPPPPRPPQPAAAPFDILHEDAHLLVVDKPAGLVVHPVHGREATSLVQALLARGIQLAGVGAPDRPGIVHRLDRETSGLLVVAKTDEAHLGMAAAFAARRVRKTYLTVVWGHPDPECDTIVRAIGRSRTDRTRMSVRTRQGREATTEYRTLESWPGFTLLEARPVTGRTHQIRVHLQSIHHPVVGDARYGGCGWKGVQSPAKRKAIRELDRLALHAFRLSFEHPVLGTSIALEAPVPAELQSLIDILREA